jgi:3-hydroxyisobutyrate dehydrogenase-like beta-hydroxyacid dehydrogenase
MNPTTQKPVVGLIGLGLVGMALAQRLIAAGYSVHGHDLRPEAAQAFQAAGGHWCSDVQQLRECPSIVLAVFQTSDVEDLVKALFLQSSAPAKTQLLMDCSTGDPERLLALAAQLAALDISFLEAPLSGSSQQIGNGQATMLLGGDPETIALHADLIRAISPKSIQAGGVGMGARAKLATNLVLGLNRAALAEGMAFAMSQGITAEAFLRMVLDSPARSDAALVKGEKMVRGDFAPQSRIKQHLKDVDVMLASAQAKNQGLPLTTRHAQLMRDAIAAGDGDLDNAAILLQIQRETF